MPNQSISQLTTASPLEVTDNVVIARGVDPPNFKASIQQIINLFPTTSGDVVGPPSVTVDGNIVRYNGTTGKIIKDGAVNLNAAGSMTGLLNVTLQGDLQIDADSKKVLFGEDQDSSIYDDGSDMILDCDELLATGRTFIFKGGDGVFEGDLEIQGKTLILGSSVLQDLSSGGDFNLDFSGAAIAGEIRYQVKNTDNTDISSHAYLQVIVGGTLGGDPIVQWTIPGGSAWSAGLDNSDSDAWVLSGSPSLSTAQMIHITSAGLVTFKNSVVVDVNLTANNTVRIFTGDLRIESDSNKLLLGVGLDASIAYDGSDMVFNSREVGGGNFFFNNGDSTFVGAKLTLDNGLTDGMNLVFKSFGNPDAVIDNSNQLRFIYDGTLEMTINAVAVAILTNDFIVSLGETFLNLPLLAGTSGSLWNDGGMVKVA